MAFPADLGTGTGFIYITAADGTTIVSQWRNDSAGEERVFAIGSGPKTSRTSSTVPYSTVWMLTGNRIFLDPTGGAAEGVMGVGAYEITDNTMSRPSTAPSAAASVTLAANVLATTRTSNTMRIALDTEAAGATDECDTITIVDVQDGDTLIINAPFNARVTTVRSGMGNIFLLGGTSWVSSVTSNKLVLTYYNRGAGIASGFYETLRSSTLPTVANQRTQSIAIGVQGTASAAMPTSGTTTFTVNTSKVFQKITGAPVLIGAVAYAAAAAPTPVEGDDFWIDYQATPVIGAFSVTLFGILLTTTQATGGALTAYTRYNGATWDSFLYQKTDGIDLVDSVALALKENDLNTPAGNDYILSSTIAGIRSWVPNSNLPVLHNDTSNDSTTAIITEEVLKTYAVPASTMATDGDIITVDGVYQTAANANGKTQTLYFGATIIGNITGAFNADTIVFHAKINRVGGTSQSATCKMEAFDSAAPGTLIGQSLMYTTPAETLSGAVNINMASTNGVAAAGDSIARQMSVSFAKKI